MKLLQLALLLLALNASAQHIPFTTITQNQPSANTTQPLPPGCGTDVLHNFQLQNTPGYAQRTQQMNNAILNFSQQNRGVATLIIPIVIHIIHNNGPENISDAQVSQGITDLNTAFANGYGASGGINTNIQFCLAKQDPDGNFTTGITRTVSTLTEMVSETQDLALKDLIRWDPTRYLNIWLVKEISSLSMGSGIAGYAYFPSAHGSAIDGIVNEAGFFGGTQLGFNSLTYDNSKVHVHEVGHYLGLYHTFEGGCGNANCQIDGDRVCDTPPDNSTVAINCYSDSANTCNTDDDDLSANNPFRPIANGGLGDQNDMIQNYMDYGYQYCQTHFTPDQSARMNAALLTSRASLLQSHGCFDVCLTPLNAQFTASDTTIFIGGQVVFTINNPNATYNWYVNGVAAGTGATFTYQHSPTGVVGNYEIKVVATNGSIECANSNTMVVTVVCQAEASYTVTSSPPYNVGATITTINTSTSSTSYDWVLDGVIQNGNTNYSHQFNAAGGHNLFLVAYAGNCADTSSTAFFTVGNCNLSGMNQNWVFNNISANFNNGNGEPTIGPSPINLPGQEITTTISDPNGNLLFFSDGVTVWDRNQNIMPNGTGLLGHWSSTQACLATPFPGNPNLYYLFTADAFENNLDNGVRYSIIDMTLNNGLGDVVPTAKNVIVRTDVGEMLTGTFHANGRDIWVLMANRHGNDFYAYLLTDQGISTTPVTSSQIGHAINMGLGPMKFSADGNMMACSMLGGWPWSIVLADFNRNTGQLTNGRDLWLSEVINEQPHSFEFSPDNSKLYVNYWSFGKIKQFNLAAGNISAIAASATVISPFPDATIFGVLGRANNGKIYMTSAWSWKLDYIANPNATGLACNYTLGTADASSPNGMSFTIPNMIQGLGQPYIPSIAGKTVICPGETTTYNVPYLTSSQTVTWSYTGNGTLTNNTDHTATLTNATGNGQLRVTVTGGCGITRDTIQIQTVPAIHPFIGNDTVVCGELHLTTSIPFDHYTWNTGSIGTSIVATPPGTYWVETIDTNGCRSQDTIVLSNLGSLPAVNLGANTAICNGNAVTLSAGPGYQSYQWQDGSGDSTYTATLPGTYWVRVTDGCNFATDSVDITTGTLSLNLNYNGDTVVCKNALPFTLNAPSGFVDYLWQDGTTNTSINVNHIGTYYVTVSDGTGCSGTDTLKVTDCTSITENAASPIKFFPNPVDDVLQLQLSGNKPIVLTILSASGQLVLKEQLNSSISTINTNALANGLYLIEMRNGDSIWRQKLVVAHP